MPPPGVSLWSVITKLKCGIFVKIRFGGPKSLYIDLKNAKISPAKSTKVMPVLKLGRNGLNLTPLNCVNPVWRTQKNFSYQVGSRDHNNKKKYICLIISTHHTTPNAPYPIGRSGWTSCGTAGGW
jgi:hypothetical protein